MRRAVIGLSLGIAAGTASAQHLEPLGYLDGGSSAQAWAVSSGNPFVVGGGEIGRDYRAFRWDFSLGMQELPPFPNQDTNATGISANGEVIVGNRDSDLRRAFRYSQGVASDLRPFRNGDFAKVNGVSADGRVTVGAANSASPAWEQPAIWIGNDPTAIPLGSFQGHPHPHGWANDASSDGAVVVGKAGSFAWRWTESTGMVDLGMLPGHIRSDAKAVSGDGRTVGGVAVSNVYTSWIWQEGEGLTALLPPIGFESAHLLDMSADGNVLVGFVGEAGDARAILWTDQAEPAILLSDYLGDAMLEDWTLRSADAISADGRFIIGEGRNELGFAESWLAVIPTPATASPLLFLLLPRRRRHT